MGDAREVGPTSVAGPEPPLTTTTTGGGSAYSINQLIPHSDFVAKAYQLPVVSQSFGYVTTMYGWGKQHNAIMRALLEGMEKTVIVSLVVVNKVATSSGIASKLSGPLHFADESACRVLDRIEHALPVITTMEPQVLIDSTRQRVHAYKQGVSDRIETAKRASSERVESVRHSATEKVQHVIETPTAGAVNKSVARGLKSADALIDIYLPRVDGDEAEKESDSQKTTLEDATTIGMPNGSVGNGHVNGGSSQYYDSSDGFRHTYDLACDVAVKLGHRVNVRAQRQQKRMKYLLIEMPASALQTILDQMAQRGYHVTQRVNDYVIEGSGRLAPKVQFIAQPMRNGLEKATTVVWTYVPPEAVARMRRFSEAAQSFIGVSIFPNGWNLNSISTVSLTDLHSEPLISHDGESNFNTDDDDNNNNYHTAADEQADDGVVFDEDNGSEEGLHYHGNGNNASVIINQNEDEIRFNRPQPSTVETTTTTTEYSKVIFATPSDEASSTSSRVSAELEAVSINRSLSNTSSSSSSTTCSTDDTTKCDHQHEGQQN